MQPKPYTQHITNVTSAYALTMSPAFVYFQSCLMQTEYTWSVQLIKHLCSYHMAIRADLSGMMCRCPGTRTDSPGPSLAYHEQEVPCRQESRLRWQQFIGQSADLLSSTVQPSGVIRSLGCAAKCIRGMHMLLLFMK